MFPALLHNVFTVFVDSGCPHCYGCLDCDRLKAELWLFFFSLSLFFKPLKSLSKTVHVKKVCVCLCSAFGDVKAVKWCMKPSLG